MMMRNFGLPASHGANSLRALPAYKAPASSGNDGRHAASSATASAGSADGGTDATLPAARRSRKSTRRGKRLRLACRCCRQGNHGQQSRHHNRHAQHNGVPQRRWKQDDHPGKGHRAGQLGKLLLLRGRLGCNARFCINFPRCVRASQPGWAYTLVMP
mgnify:CR=1 FL=1